MKQQRSILLCLMLCSTLCFPLLFFKLDDAINAFKSEVWDTSSQQELAQYPLIARIYSNYYHSMEEAQQVLYELESSTKTAQVQEIQDHFTTQINALLEKQIIQPHYLHITAMPFQVAFGTIREDQVDQIAYQYELNQTYSMSESGAISASYTMDAQTTKITKLHLYSQDQITLSEEEKKTALWAYLTYLELDDIEDWTYTKAGFESYQAKLQVYLDLTMFSQQSTFGVGIAPLGQLSYDHVFLS